MQEESKNELMVTIRCLAYNHEPYIRQCLDGFVMQRTNFRFEAIVHDDASTDGTATIIREYAEKYPDIIKPIFETENQYSKRDGSIRRIMNEHTHGKYIAFCEGDDYWIDPLKLQKQVDFLENNINCSLCFHNAYYENSILNKRVGKHKIYSKSQYASDKHIFRDGGFIPTASIVARTFVYQMMFSSHFPMNCPVGDLRFQLFAATCGDVYYLNEVMSVYRLVPTSVTHQWFKEKNKLLLHYIKLKDWYISVNEYTDKKYYKLIDESIAFVEARIARVEKNYFLFWKKRYWSYLASLTLQTRIGIIAGMCGFSFITEMGKNILRKRRKM